MCNKFTPIKPAEKLMSNTLKVRCEVCGVLDETVKNRLDPYSHDVLNKEVYIVMCDYCEQCSREDI